MNDVILADDSYDPELDAEIVSVDQNLVSDEEWQAICRGE